MAQRYIKGGLFRKVTYENSGDGWHFKLNFQPLEKKVFNAQLKLDAQVWEDMQQYMPYDENHTLINSTGALNAQACGSGKVYKYDPLSDYGHYQYEGFVYVDPEYGYAAYPLMKGGVLQGFRSRPGVEKVKSNRLIHYNNRNARRHWDEVAINNHKKEWEQLVLEELTK